MPSRPPSAHSLRSLLNLPGKPPIALPLRPSHPEDLHLAKLLSSSHTSQSPVHLLVPSDYPHPLNSFQSCKVHTVPTKNTSSSALRPFVRTALQNGLSTVVLSDTSADRIQAAVLKQQILSDHTVPHDLQVVPEGVLTYHRPLLHQSPQQLEHILPQLAPHTRSRLSSLFGDSVSFAQLLSHTENIHDMIVHRKSMSDFLLKQCVLQASHWGYLAVRRSLLAEWYHSDRRYIALHVISRLIAHVSGNPVSPHDEQLVRLADEILQINQKGTLQNMPKGRTVGGVVVRPATGRFAKRLITRRRHSHTQGTEEVMLWVREPDQESGRMQGRRLRGNWACLPLQIDGPGVYWDDRFVIQVSSLQRMRPLDGMEVLLSALDDGDETPDWAAGDLYVRQMRRVDWDMVAREVGGGQAVPYHCVRGLPAIFERNGEGDGINTVGMFLASPHLGISGSGNLVFTAVRVPRIRCLPKHIEPGFCMDDFNGGGEVSEA